MKMVLLMQGMNEMIVRLIRGRDDLGRLLVTWCSYLGMIYLLFMSIGEAPKFIRASCRA